MKKEGWKEGRDRERTGHLAENQTVSNIKTHGPNFKRAMLGTASMLHRNWAKQ